MIFTNKHFLPCFAWLVWFDDICPTPSGVKQLSAFTYFTYVYMMYSCTSQHVSPYTEISVFVYSYILYGLFQENHCPNSAMQNSSVICHLSVVVVVGDPLCSTLDNFNANESQPYTYSIHVILLSYMHPHTEGNTN